MPGGCFLLEKNIWIEESITMPQTKKQEIVYTVMMVCVMVYGMV